jgi:hypothetical protein
VTSDLVIARRCGWRYEWVRDLDADIHQVLIEELLREDAARGGE